MRRLAVLCALSISTAVAVAAVPAHAVPPTATVTVECTMEGAFITVTAGGQAARYNLWVDGTMYPPDQNDIFLNTILLDIGDSFSYGPVSEGTHSVELDRFNLDGTVAGVHFLDNTYDIDCDPLAEVDSSCEEDGGSIVVQIVDDAAQSFDILIDDQLVDEDVAAGTYNYSPIENGAHQVTVRWNHDSSNVVSESVELTCEVNNPDDTDGDGDSGAGLPDAGSNSSEVAVAATVLVLLGVLMTRLRLRPARRT